MQKQTIKKCIHGFMFLCAIFLIVIPFLASNLENNSWLYKLIAQKHVYVMNDIRKLKSNNRLDYNEKGFKEIVRIMNFALQTDHLVFYENHSIKEELVANDFKFLWLEVISNENNTKYLRIKFMYSDHTGFGARIEEEYFYNMIALLSKIILSEKAI